MNTLYITDSGRVMLDDNNNPKNINCDREAISSIMCLEEDINIVYNKKGKTTNLSAKAGDILITFYEDTFDNPVVVVTSPQWKENIDAYKAKEQKLKEEWAKRKEECKTKVCSEVTDNCCNPCF